MICCCKLRTQPGSFHPKLISLGSPAITAHCGRCSIKGRTESDGALSFLLILCADFCGFFLLLPWADMRRAPFDQPLAPRKRNRWQLAKTPASRHKHTFQKAKRDLQHPAACAYLRVSDTAKASRQRMTGAAGLLAAETWPGLQSFRVFVLSETPPI